MRIALIGATGLVGSALLDQLLATGDVEVHSISRRPSGRAHRRLQEHVALPERWPEIAGGIGANATVSTLGTTMRAAGSQAAFRAVDLDMVVAFAAAARAAGADRMVAVSSVGADAGSRNFYLRTKGEMEQALEALGFARLDILGPGLLRGERAAEPRPAERLGTLLSPLTNLLLRGRLDRFAAIDANIVAAAAASALRQAPPGLYRHDNRAIRHLAGR
ncbi:NAD(P)H-binding protein [Sphingosinicella sp. LY1275]|uniref:NAD(P)H-binding protein n=1 Tax=Sphingosinicella sp. LY1275 TaxID=3095379 RepID=UPI002ADEA902|nr:NAD(P)H-binding protein [Sphingosinicella sp. LY1275]MEA1015711.1 NAD(P)H-binding protein [Sphingosinicella sp. LY1275]